MLDRNPEQDFDELARLAAQICGTPMAFVSAVDADRVWFKARIGLDVGEVPRDGAFCGATVLGRDALVVEDARQDGRFSGHALAAFGIRFYAGVPLLDPEGTAIGAVGVLDRVPRTVTTDQVDALRMLSRHATALLEWRRTAAALRESEELKTRIIDSSPDCIKVLDLDGRLLSMNTSAPRSSLRKTSLPRACFRLMVT